MSAKNTGKSRISWILPPFISYLRKIESCLLYLIVEKQMSVLRSFERAK
jgi:hypothetical protein